MPTRRRSSLAWSLALLPALALTARHAEAGPRRKPAPARVDLAAAVATGDDVAMCRAAIATVTAGDHVRASLVLPACATAVARAPELADRARAARVAVARTAERQDWSPVELVVRPAGTAATLTLDAYPGLPVGAGRHLLPAGRYRVTAHNASGDVTYDLTVADGSRALVLIDVPTAPAPAVAGVLDFTEGEPTAPMAGPPPVIKRGSLLPDRFLRGLNARPPRRP